MDRATRAQLSSQTFELAVMLVHSTSQEVSGILRMEGLNPAQLQLLHAIAARPRITQAELTRRRGVTAGSVSLLIDKVEAAGLVRRVADGASNRLSLTHKGKLLVERLAPAQDDFFADLFTSLSDRELGQLSRLVQRAFDGLPWKGQPISHDDGQSAVASQT